MLRCARSTPLRICDIGGSNGQRVLAGTGLGCAGKLGNMSSPRPAHPGAIIPRSSRRVDRPVLDAMLVGGAAQSARTAAGAVQGTHRQPSCLFDEVLCFVVGEVTPGIPANAPHKTSQKFPNLSQNPTQSADLTRDCPRDTAAQQTMNSARSASCSSGGRCRNVF